MQGESDRKSRNFLGLPSYLPSLSRAKTSPCRPMMTKRKSARTIVLVCTRYDYMFVRS